MGVIVVTHDESWRGVGGVSVCSLVVVGLGQEATETGEIIRNAKLSCMTRQSVKYSFCEAEQG